MTTATSRDLDDVRGKLTELAASGRVDELIELVITLLGSAQSSNTALTSRLQNALRALYGRKSEKFSADQLSLLFAELGDEAPVRPARTPSRRCRVGDAESAAWRELDQLAVGFSSEVGGTVMGPTSRSSSAPSSRSRVAAQYFGASSR